MSERKPKCWVCTSYGLSMASSLGSLRTSIEKAQWKDAEWYGRQAFESFTSLKDCISEYDKKELADYFGKLKLAIVKADKERAEEYARLIQVTLDRAMLRMFSEKRCEFT